MLRESRQGKRLPAFIILNRFLKKFFAKKNFLRKKYFTNWDELVYVPKYRDYSPNYVRIMEDEYRDRLANTIFILLYTTDFNIMQDDGLSHDFARRQEEQDDFIKIFQESRLNKLMIQVNDGDGYAGINAVRQRFIDQMIDYIGQEI